MENSIPDVVSLQESHVLKTEKKRLKLLFAVLPFDCWSYILQFIKENNDFLKVLYSVKGLYHYIKNQNSFCTWNRVFKVFDFPPHSNGNIYGHVHRIDVGYPRKSSSRKFRDVNKTKLMKTLFKVFPNLSRIKIDCGAFKKIRSCSKVKIEILPKGSHDIKTLDKLKEIEIVFYGYFDVILYSDLLPNVESIHVGRSSSEDNIYHGSRRRRSCCSSLYCHKDSRKRPLPRLRRLVISSDLISMNPDLVGMIFRQLRYLELKDTSIRGFTQEISDLPFLEELRLNKISGEGMKICKLPVLRKLIIVEGDRIEKWDICLDTFSSLEEAFLDLVEITRTTTFLDTKKLRKLYIDLHGKIDDTDQDYYWRRSYKKVHILGGFHDSVKELSIRSSLSAISILSLLGSGVRDLDLHVKDHEIVVKDDLISCKKTLTKIGIRQYWREILFPERGVSLSFFKGSHSFTRKNLYFSKFLCLKELILTNYLINEIRVSKCPVLEKIEFRFRTFCPTIVEENSTELFVISDCPNLRSLFLDDNVSSYTQIRGDHSKLRRLKLRDSKRFPHGLKLEKIEELNLIECYPSLFEFGGGVRAVYSKKKEIHGIFFPELKRLKICQSFYDRRRTKNNLSIVSIDSDDEIQELKSRVKEVAVERISNMKNLKYLRIRTRMFYRRDEQDNNNINESGILKIQQIHPKCMVEIQEGKPLSCSSNNISFNDKRSYEYLNKVKIEKVTKFQNTEEFMKFFRTLKTVVEIDENNNQDENDEDLIFVSRRRNDHVVIDISDEEEEEEEDQKDKNEVIIID